MKVEDRLKEYKANISKINLLNVEEKELLRQLELNKPSYITAAHISDTPPSKTNKFSSQVENFVIEQEKLDKRNNQIRIRLAEIAEERFRYQCQIDRVDALLDCLGAEERFIVEKFYFDKLKMRYVQEEYKKRFGEYRETKTLQLIKKNALQKMQKIKGSA